MLQILCILPFYTYVFYRAYTPVATDEVEMQGGDDKAHNKPKLPNWRNPTRVIELLRAAGLFGLIMCYFYYCDYLKALPAGMNCTTV